MIARRGARGEGGFALLFSFWMFVILLMMVLAHGYWMYQEIPLTQAYVDDLRARALAWGALNIAAGALLEDISGSDSDLGVVVTEVMMFGENRADVRFNEASENDVLEIFNNSDFPQDVTGWKVYQTSGASPGTPIWTLSGTIDDTMNGTPAINNTLPNTLYLVTDEGDTIDSITIVGTSAAGKTWQVLPDGSNGEYWAGQRLPADVSVGGPHAPGWVNRASTLGAPNGEGEWILPLSVVYNRTTNESYVFQARATGDTLAYWVPADTYFIISAGATRSEFNSYFSLGTVGSPDKDDIAPDTLLYDGGAGKTKAVQSWYDDSSSLADLNPGTTNDSFLFPLTFPGSRVEIYFLRPEAFKWRFHSDTYPILYRSVSLPAPVANHKYTYGRIASRNSPYWRSFMHVGGDTTRLADGISIASYGPNNAAQTPDTYWNWLVPGDSSTLVRAGSFAGQAGFGDWKDTFGAFSPYDNHARTGNDSSLWWTTSSLDPYFKYLYGSLGEWDTYANQSTGLNVSEVANMPAAAASWADTIVIAEFGNKGDNAACEYVVLFNPTATADSLAGWKINSSSGSPQASFTAAHRIGAYGYFLVGDDLSVATCGSQPANDLVDAITLASTNAWVSLINASGSRGDTVGWGASAAFYEGSPTTAGDLSAATMALRRNPPSDTGLDRNNNSLDFTYTTTTDPPRKSSAASPPPANVEKYDFVEFYSSAYDTSGGTGSSAEIIHPWTGSRYGGGLTERDHAYEYIEIHNTSDSVSINMDEVEFEVSSNTSTWTGTTVRKIQPWRSGDTTYIPPGGCGLILPVGADTYVVNPPAGAVLFGLGPSGAAAATDTQLAFTRPFNNRGDYFRIGNGYSGAQAKMWYLNFGDTTFRRGVPWVKSTISEDSSTVGTGDLSQTWIEGSASPGACPSDVDHLLEDWATLTRNTSTGANDFVQFGSDPEAYVRIWVYDESGRLAFNQGVTGHLTNAYVSAASGAFSSAPVVGPDGTQNDLLDTYVTNMDLFYLDGVSAAKLKNFTVYADTLVNLNTADQYATGAGPNIADVNVIRAICKAVLGGTDATNEGRAQSIIDYRRGADNKDGTTDDKICYSDNGIEQYLVNAGLSVADAQGLANSDSLSVRSTGYFTVVGEGLVVSNLTGDTLGHRSFWAVFERGWTGRTSPGATSKKGSWRYWRDNWHTATNISNEGGIIQF